MTRPESARTNTIRTLAVAGAGYMGWQIALQSAVHGVPVRLIDVSEAALEQSLARQREQLQVWQTAGRVTAGQSEEVLARISRLDDLRAAASADLVIEAIPERLELKRDLFARLDAVCPAHTIFATNSSSLRISQIEDVVERRDRVLNLHFFGPVWVRPMAELMGGTATSEETFQAASEFVCRIGITPLRVRRESTGFLFNRVWRAIKKESLRVAGSGVASVEDIDRAWMIFMQHPMGPFGLMDEIGLDVIRDIELVYYRESGDPSDAPPQFLLDLIAQGHLGVKTGRGFYTYPNPAFEQPGFLREGITWSGSG